MGVVGGNDASFLIISCSAPHKHLLAPMGSEQPSRLTSYKVIYYSQHSRGWSITRRPTIAVWNSD